MIAENAEFRGFDVERYQNLARLFGFRPGRPWAGPQGLLILRRDGAPVLAFHSRRGPLEPEAIPDRGEGLEALTRRLGARWALAVDLEALEAMHEATASQMRVGEDMAELVLQLIKAGDEQKQAGRIELYPDFFEGLRPPSRAAIDKVFDLLLPRRTSALLYVFDGSRLYAEAIVARGPKEIRLIGGHEVLRSGPPPRRWREEYKSLLQAAETEVGPPTLGVFVSLDAARAMLRGDPSFELSRAMARKDLILDPLPLWLAGPLGVVAVRNAVAFGKRAGERIRERVRPTGLAGRLAARAAGKVAGRVRSALEDRLRDNLPMEQIGETVEGLRKRADLAEILGFDPFLLGRKVADFLREGASDR